jgi:hypothetical protein
MSAKKQTEFELGMDPPPAVPEPSPGKLDLTIKVNPGNIHSPAQVEFNKRLKALEKARAALERRRAYLDNDLVICREKLMPLLEKRNQTEYQLIILTHAARKTLKLTKRRAAALEDLLCFKLEGLLDDPVGLGEEETKTLESIFDELDPQPDNSEPDEEEKEAIREEFEDIRAYIEALARKAGLELDLEGLDPNIDPAELDMEIQRRILAAAEKSGKSPNLDRTSPRRGRKPSKAALERERQRKETEEAKKRDFKTLYKQLAKVLHPDLETDPALKQHKQSWMQRLTAAHASGDLHAMLAIEIEWLGEEAGNLAKATDEKLRVYSLVLKEQLDDLKQQTSYLSHQPEYFPLRRFLHPYEERLNTNIIQINLEDEIYALTDMLDSLRKGGTAARIFIHDTADHHARNYGY